MIKELRFSKENEVVRASLEKHLSERGIKNKQIAKISQLSSSTITLFLQGRREIVPEKLDIIRKWINQ